MRFLILTLVLSGIVGVRDVSAQKRGYKKPVNTPPVVKMKLTIPKKDDLKTIWSDAQSGVEEPFIFVARNPAQYGELQKLSNSLPAANTIDFSKNAVVAAFAGMRPTPGYGISFVKTANGVKVEATAPPKDAIAAQVITYPARVVLVPVEEEQGLRVEAGRLWQSKIQTFRVTSGVFEFTGGFAPIEKKFPLAGTIAMMRSGDFVTMFFNVNATNETQRRMFEAASGQINGKSVMIQRLDTGNLADNPRPPVKAVGAMNGRTLTLTFEPLPTNVADGYEGKGKLTATLIK